MPRGAGHRGTARPCAARAGGGEPGRGRDTRREHADDQVGGLARRSAPSRAASSRGVAARSMAAARRLPARRWAKWSPSYTPGLAMSRRKTQSPARPGARAQQAHAVQRPAFPAQAGQAAGEHLGHDVVARAQGAGEDHRAFGHRPAPPRIRARPAWPPHRRRDAGPTRSPRRPNGAAPGRATGRGRPHPRLRGASRETWEWVLQPIRTRTAPAETAHDQPTATETRPRSPAGPAPGWPGGSCSCRSG